MTNDIETINTISNNNLNYRYFSTIRQQNQVIYIVKVVYITGFILLTNIFIIRLSNFLNLKLDRLYIIRSIMYKSKHKKTRNFVQKNKNVYLYITKYIYNLLNKEMFLI